MVEVASASVCKIAGTCTTVPGEAARRDVAEWVIGAVPRKLSPGGRVNLGGLRRAPWVDVQSTPRPRRLLRGVIEAVFDAAHLRVRVLEEVFPCPGPHFAAARGRVLFSGLPLVSARWRWWRRPAPQGIRR